QILEHNDCELMAIVSPEQPSWMPETFSPTWLKADEDVLDFSSNDYLLVNGLGSLPANRHKRSELHVFFKHQGYEFKTVIAKNAVVSRYSQLGEGVQVFPGSVVNQCSVGQFTIINSGAVIEHDVQIGKNCHIAPGAVLCGEVELGEQVHVGAGATIIQGVEVGNGVVIGAGAIVTKNVPASHTVYPAKGLIKG
ncbi:MAG TPA: acetyltransferase, partial [Idiomarina sp.]|nr:acetyltransferase [Idiomarina sp.]